MTDDAMKIRSRWPAFLGNPGDFLRSLVFFGAVYFCCWRWVDLRLIYHGGGVITNFPVFYWGWDFFQEFLSRPGGVLNYSYALMSQCLMHSHAGPLAVASLAWLLYLSADVFLKSIGAGRMRMLGFAPPLLLLALCSKYIYYMTGALTGATILAGWIAACLYVKTRPDCVYLRGAWILAIGAASCLLAGGAAPIFFLLCLIFELRGQDRWGMAPAVLLIAGATFLAGLWIYGLTASEMFAGFFPFAMSAKAFKSQGLAMLHAMCLGLPVFLLVWLLWEALFGRFFAAHGKIAVSSRGDPHASQKIASGREIRTGKGSGWALLRWAAWTALLVVATGAVARMAANAELKAVLQVDYYCYRKMWPQALEAARASAGNNIHVICSMNQALFHTGRLGDDLPLTQDAETLLLYDQKYRPDWNVIDIYLELGFINMAHHYLVEAVEMYGERPSLLRRLALVYVAIGNPGTARIYFNSLKNVPFHAAWSEEYLRKMDIDPTLAGDEEVARMRQSMMKDDHIIPLPMDTLMVKLLEWNKNNRMAFEYLTAYCLLTKNIPAWVGHLGRLEDFSWGELPRYYQEAIVVAVRGLGLKPALKAGHINPEYVRRYDHFVQSMKTFGSDRQKAAEALRKDYGDSYFYYFYLR
jgi:hypothetical protein